MRIDAHQHFWQYTDKEYGWISDDMAILRQDHLPGDLQKILKANGFDGSVAVQARQSLEETQWLLQLADQSSIIKGVVGWVDLQSAQIAEQLQRFSAHRKFVGVRHVVQDEPDDRFLLGSAFLNGIEKLAAFNLAYDILIFPKQLPAANEFVRRFPEQRFVLDHIAKPLIKDGIISPWDEQIHELAQCSNVYCKISGMVTEADWQSWQQADFTPYLDIIFKAFGPERIMFGSDWPVCTVAVAFEKVIEIVQSWLEINKISEKYQKAFWGENAEKFYQLNF